MSDRSIDELLDEIADLKSEVAWISKELDQRTEEVEKLKKLVADMEANDSLEVRRGNIPTRPL